MVSTTTNSKQAPLTIARNLSSKHKMETKTQKPYTNENCKTNIPPCALESQITKSDLKSLHLGLYYKKKTI